ncbi:GNAT family N-acetyltransferase [Synechococcus sp. CBW1107]|uniref:GNAT family N-acetyltransferase n=1 Tax=Synechococcus sp. CBW1107 TaxID=2789857 RepID=UPI002AD52AC3|nr:GNAT family N-acetyltransferase [Synechococcus sp. CBW1107]
MDGKAAIKPLPPPEPAAESGTASLIRHGPGALGLRLGLGPGRRPVGAIGQLQVLLDAHSFWAQGRSIRQLRRMLRSSQAAVTVWEDRRLIGFGRATSDGVFRAVLWDVVVADGFQGRGIGRRLVECLLKAPLVAATERTYLMTTNSGGFYGQLGFKNDHRQQLLLLERNGGEKSG